MKKTLKKLRSNILIAKILIFIFKPIYKLAQKLLVWIPKHIRPNEAEVNFYGHKIYFPKNIGGSILNALYWKKNGFEPEIGYLMNLLAKKNDVFIDVGTNIGIYSVLVQKSNPNIKTLCIEPIKELVKKSRVFQNANNTTNYELFEVALSDSTGETEIFVPALDEFQETTTASLSNTFFYNQKLKGEYRKIKKYRFYDFIDALKTPLQGNVLIKIDVEGHELSVLRGCEDYLISHKPLVFLEIEMTRENIKNYFSLNFHKYYNTYKIFNGFIVKVSEYDLGESKSADNFLLLPVLDNSFEKNIIKFHELG
jgi:FkbM family methyltransferase